MLDRKMRTEKSGSPWFSSALDLAQDDRCVVRVYPRPEKRLGRDDSLEANGLMLVRKSANRKSESYGFPEGERFSHAVARW